MMAGFRRGVPLQNNHRGATLENSEYLAAKENVQPVELENLKRVFKWLDTKKDDRICWQELSEALVKLGCKTPKDQIELWIWEVDDDLDQMVGWDEFLTMYQRCISDGTGFEPRNLFNLVQFLMYDKDNSFRKGSPIQSRLFQLFDFLSPLLRSLSDPRVQVILGFGFPRCMATFISATDLEALTSGVETRDWVSLYPAAWDAVNTQLGTVSAPSGAGLHASVSRARGYYCCAGASPGLRHARGSGPCACPYQGTYGRGMHPSGVNVPKRSSKWDDPLWIHWPPPPPVVPAVGGLLNPPAAPPAPAAAGAARKVKNNQVLDQTDEAEIPELGQADIDKHLKALQKIKGGPVRPEAEPSPDQISAMKVFSNTLLTLEVQVDQDTLPVASLSALDEYKDAFRDLVRNYGESWHLCVAAEDRCRSEHVARLRRALEEKHQKGLAPGLSPPGPGMRTRRGGAGWRRSLAESRREETRKGDPGPSEGKTQHPTTGSFDAPQDEQSTGHFQRGNYLGKVTRDELGPAGTEQDMPPTSKGEIWRNEGEGRRKLHRGNQRPPQGSGQAPRWQEWGAKAAWAIDHCITDMPGATSIVRQIRTGMSQAQAVEAQGCLTQLGSRSAAALAKITGTQDWDDKGPTGWRWALMRDIVRATRDPDLDVPEWLGQGTPLGESGFPSGLTHQGPAGEPSIWHSSAIRLRSDQACGRAVCCLQGRPVRPGVGPAGLLITKTLALWSALGTRLALHRAGTGKQIKWIGATFEVLNNGVKVSVDPERIDKLRQTVTAGLQSSGLVKGIRGLAGELSWAAGIVPTIRPFVKMLWAAVYGMDQQQATAKAGTCRNFQGANQARRFGLRQNGRHAAHVAPHVSGRTTWGPVQDEAANRQVPGWSLQGLDITTGEPGLMTIYELLALLLAMHVWKRYLQRCRIGILVQLDNEAAIRIAVKMASPHRLTEGKEVPLRLRCLLR
eukprot:s1002_g5.t1